MKQYSQLSSLKEFLFKYKYVFLFLFAFVILYARSSYNLKTPTMYAEEGVWTSDIMENGTKWAIVNSRDDYFTFFINLMLSLANKADILIFNGDLTFLPYLIAFISYAFLAFLAILPALTLGKRLNWFGKLFLYFSILLLPMGTSSTEVIGKVLQFHFYMWIIVFCLLIYRYDNKNMPGKKWVVVLADLGILGAIATIPTVLVLVFTYFLIEFKDIIQRQLFHRHGKVKPAYLLKETISHEFHKVSTWQMLIFGLVSAVLGLLIIVKMSGYTNPEPEVAGDAHNIIEFLVRSLSYIFVWPFYGSLTVAKGVIVLIFTALFFIAGYFLIRKTSRTFYLLTIASLVFNTIITLSTRFFLTSYLSQFSFSGIPDRYYILMNLCSLFPIAIIISDGFRRQDRQTIRFFAAITVVYLVALNGFNLNTLLQWDKSLIDYPSNITFEERLLDSYRAQRLTPDGKFYLVTIDPEGSWVMRVPLDRMEQSV